MGSDLRYWIGFNLVSQIGPAKVERLIEYFGNLETAWNANPFDLVRAGLDKRALENLTTTRKTLDLPAEIDKAQRACDLILTWDDPAYPRRLRQIPHAPSVLYIKGKLAPEDEWSIGVVGTRQASTYGKEVARQFVADLVRNQLTIVSGLARGIDAEAHRMAIEKGGRTLAILGNGIDVVYPPEHIKLSHDIIEHGALITEYPVGAKPDAMNFPARNRIISGWSLGVLLIEGDETSGAMITADFALEQDREVFAVPGNIYHRQARGPNKLIRESRAKLVTKVEDILEELNLTLVAEQAEARAIVPENPTEATLLKLLSSDPVHIDELRQQSGLAIAEVSSTLTLMELKGIVRQVGGMNYVIAREAGTGYAGD
ncbi:MAG: DNA-processing protein DprA [Anaerolineae bacterium]